MVVKVKRWSDACPPELKFRHVGTFVSTESTFGAVKPGFRSLGMAHFLSACVPVVFGLLLFLLSV